MTWFDLLMLLCGVLLMGNGEVCEFVVSLLVLVFVGLGLGWLCLCVLVCDFTGVVCCYVTWWLLGGLRVRSFGFGVFLVFM